MAINPIAAARKEAQRQTYIDEERKLVELGNKRKEEEERKAFSEGLGILESNESTGLYQSPVDQIKNGVFFNTVGSYLKDDNDKKDEKWEKNFITSFAEETGTTIY